MAKTAFIDAPPELQALFDNLMRRIAAQTTGSIGIKGRIRTPAQKRAVSTRSLLPEISALWAGLSTEEKNAWREAANQSSYNMWNLFVQDQAYRLKFGIEGIAEPNIYHQYKVGRGIIEAPATQMRLVQHHPSKYYVWTKIKGTKAQYHDVAINERLVLPLEIGLSYRTNLSAVGDAPRARFFAEILSHYQGRDILTPFGFDLELQADWNRQTVVCTEVLGVARSYDLWLDFFDVRGAFEWDNLRAFHTGTNYARDFRCTDVNTQLTKKNYMIAKSWEADFIPSGTDYGSVYPQDVL